MGREKKNCLSTNDTETTRNPCAKEGSRLEGTPKLSTPAESICEHNDQEVGPWVRVFVNITTKQQ